MIRSAYDSTTGVMTLSLDRAAKKNAMTPAMLDELLREIERANAPIWPPRSVPPKAVLLTGEGDTFCAGFDLVMCREDEAVLPALLTGLSRAARGLRRLPMPVVAAVQGSAIAGGCALLGGADVVVTHESAKLGYPVARLGISPAVTSPLLRLSIHDGATRERLLGGSIFDGKDAVKMGLAHECVAEAAEVLPRAKKIVEELAAKPRAAIAATKQLLGEIEGTAGDAVLDAGLSASLSLVGGDEQKTLLGAFLDKSLKGARG